MTKLEIIETILMRFQNANLESTDARRIVANAINEELEDHSSRQLFTADDILEEDGKCILCGDAFHDGKCDNPYCPNYTIL